MLIKTITYLLIVLGFFSTLKAKELGPDVSVYRGEELKWENGAYGYHVMVTKLPPEYKDCIENSGSSDNVSLSADAIPQDAYVERAFLIWGGTQNVDKIDELTDSEVTLVINSYDIEFETITLTGYKVTEPQGFEFDSILETYYYEKPFFTYRADVTGFFEKLREKGREFGVEYDGESFVGDYHLSGLDCWSFGTFAESGSSIRMWALVIIYKSYLLTPQNIKIFDGLEELTDSIDPEDFGCVDSDQKCTLLTDIGAFDLFTFENKDRTISNLLITSEKAVSSNFDIPDQPELVACTPANIPLNPDNPDSFWCESGEHTFAIRIQNWGNSDAEKIVVKAEIPKGMEYIRGTTEYADEFCIYQNKKHAEIFRNISDNENGFPLADGFNITELSGKLSPCPEDSDYITCENTIIIRFKAKLKESTPKHFVIESSANIETYNSNQGIPLKLRYSGSSDCGIYYSADVSDCGGYPEACNPCGNNDAESGNSNDSENIDTETIPDLDDKALINDSDTETDEKDSNSGCNVLII